MLEALVDSAFEYAYPLYAVARTRWRAVQDPSNPRRHAPNTLQHERHLSDHTSRWITAPNNDTLYSNAWLDLSSGPVRIRVGAMPAGRYWSVALMDAFTNHFAVIGQRLDGTGPVDVVLVGPQHGDAGAGGRIIRAPGNDAWMFCRCDGSLDIALQHDAPTEDTLRANWLPAPAGPFQISLRTYLPRAELRDASARMPQIIRA